jgi:hypothetical protein
MNKEKELTIKLLTEKLEKLSNKKIKLEGFSSGSGEGSELRILKQIKSKKIDALKALHLLETLFDHHDYDDVEEAVEQLGLKYSPGSGGMELFLDNLGYSLTPADIQKMDGMEIANLLANIFYNRVANGLLKFVPSVTIDAIVKRIQSNIKLKKFMSEYESDSDGEISKSKIRRADAIKIVNALK